MSKALLDKYLRRLHQLRRDGWEKDILLYGIPFDESEATCAEIQHHVWRIEKHRKEVIKKRIVKALEVIAVIALVVMFFWR